jgi:hypothetical protein
MRSAPSDRWQCNILTERVKLWKASFSQDTGTAGDRLERDSHGRSRADAWCDQLEERRSNGKPPNRS